MRAPLFFPTQTPHLSPKTHHYLLIYTANHYFILHTPHHSLYTTLSPYLCLPLCTPHHSLYTTLSPHLPLPSSMHSPPLPLHNSISPPPSASLYALPTTPSAQLCLPTSASLYALPTIVSPRPSLSHFLWTMGPHGANLHFLMESSILRQIPCLLDHFSVDCFMAVTRQPSTTNTNWHTSTRELYHTFSNSI